VTRKKENEPLLGLLQVAASIAEEFVPLTEHLAGAELTQASSDTGILLDINREIQEGFVP
jgi:hypothetical protein